MGFLSSVAPLAGAAFGGPLGGMVGGMIAAKSARDEALDRQKQTAQAAADAQRVSWARRPGSQQYIPQVEMAGGTDTGNLMGGALGGYMQGQEFAKNGGGLNWQDLFGSKKPAPPTGYLGVNTDLGMGGSAPMYGANSLGATGYLKR